MPSSREWIDYTNVPGVFDWVIGVLGVVALGFAGWQQLGDKRHG